MDAIAAETGKTAQQIAMLARASDATPPHPYYPYLIQEGFARLNPPPV